MFSNTKEAKANVEYLEEAINTLYNDMVKLTTDFRSRVNPGLPTETFNHMNTQAIVIAAFRLGCAVCRLVNMQLVPAKKLWKLTWRWAVDNVERAELS